MSPLALAFPVILSIINILGTPSIFVSAGATSTESASSVRTVSRSSTRPNRCSERWDTLITSAPQCTGCLLEASEPLALSFPGETVYTTVTKTLVNFTIVDALGKTSYSISEKLKTVTTTEDVEPTTAALNPITWEWEGVTLTYPTTYFVFDRIQAATWASASESAQCSARFEDLPLAGPTPWSSIVYEATEPWTQYMPVPLPLAEYLMQQPDITAAFPGVDLSQCTARVSEPCPDGPGPDSNSSTPYSRTATPRTSRKIPYTTPSYLSTTKATTPRPSITTLRLSTTPHFEGRISTTHSSDTITIPPWNVTSCLYCNTTTSTQLNSSRSIAGSSGASTTLETTTYPISQHVTQRVLTTETEHSSISLTASIFQGIAAPHTSDERTTSSPSAADQQPPPASVAPPKTLDGTSEPSQIPPSSPTQPPTDGSGTGKPPPATSGSPPGPSSGSSGGEGSGPNGAGSTSPSPSDTNNAAPTHASAVAQISGEPILITETISGKPTIRTLVSLGTDALSGGVGHVYLTTATISGKLTTQTLTGFETDASGGESREPILRTETISGKLMTRTLTGLETDAPSGGSEQLILTTETVSGKLTTRTLTGIETDALSGGSGKPVLTTATVSGKLTTMTVMSLDTDTSSGGSEQLVLTTETISGKLTTRTLTSLGTQASIEGSAGQSPGAASTSSRPAGARSTTSGSTGEDGAPATRTGAASSDSGAHGGGSGQFRGRSASWAVGALGFLLVWA